MHVAVDPRRTAVPASVMVAASLIGLLAPGGYDLPHHMFVMAAEPRLSRYVTSCTGGRPSGRTVVHGLRARWITCPEGSEMNSGHVVLAWVQGGIDYAVTIHGDFPLTRMIAAAVAGAVRIER